MVSGILQIPQRSGGAQKFRHSPYEMIIKWLSAETGVRTQIDPGPSAPRGASCCWALRKFFEPLPPTSVAPSLGSVWNSQPLPFPAGLVLGRLSQSSPHPLPALSSSPGLLPQPFFLFVLNRCYYPVFRGEKSENADKEKG